MLPNKNVTLLLVFIYIIYALFAPKSLFAAISDCSVSVTPSSLSGGSSTSLVFSIKNNDVEGNLLHWVQITSPSSDFTITSADGPSLGAVDIASSGSSVSINTTLSSGETGDYTIGITTGNSAVSNGSFTVKGSATDDVEAVTCTGSSSVSISANTSAILQISNIHVSASDTSATVTWTTGGSTTGRVEYGVSSSYGSQETDINVGTSHSVTLSNLNASSTYHLRVTSIYSDNDSLASSDVSFTTADHGAITTTTTTVTTNTTRSFIKEIKDTTPPKVSILTNFSKVYKEAPLITGEASDNGGIATIFYSVDRGQNWIGIALDENVGAKKVRFEFTPEIIDDGNYGILVKAIDSTGNERKSNEETLVIDKLPPVVGGSILTLGAIILSPDESGTIQTLSNLNTKITLSAAGGPTNISLFIDSQEYKLQKNTENGLWTGVINFPTEGTYTILAKLEDGANNRTSQKLSPIIVHSGGRVHGETNIQNAEITVFSFDEMTQKFNVWNSAPFGQGNPQKTSDSGGYSLFLPSGKFYVEVKAPLLKKIRSSIFVLQNPTPVSVDFTLKKSQSFYIDRLLEILGIDTYDESIIVNPVLETAHGRTDLLGAEIPYFEFSSKFRGKPTVFTFLASWLPQSPQQIEELEEAKKEFPGVNFVVIGVQEAKARFEIFMKRGGYTVESFADTDGIFIEPLYLTTYPTHVFLDRKGIIKEVFAGIIDKKQIQDRLIY